MRRTLAVFTCLTIMVFSFCSLGRAGIVTPDLQAILASTQPGVRVPVIVTFRNQVDVNQFNETDRRLKRQRIIEALRALAKASQAQVVIAAQASQVSYFRQLWLINGLALDAPPALINLMASAPDVAEVRYDALVTLEATTAAASRPAEWNIDAVGARSMWGLGFTGQGVVVGFMDTGVDINHPDLQSKWRGGTNSWFDPNGEHAAPSDTDGHGTGVASLAVGGNSGGASIGVAPGAQWIAVKIFSDAGVASLSGIHEGFQWLLDPDNNPATDDAPHVVNNSWVLQNTVGICNTEFQDDIDVLRTAGIAVVFAAGNSGPSSGSDVSPSNNPGAFSVGSVDSNIVIASGSSRGPSSCDGSIFPQVVAPGVGVKAADLTFGGVFPDNYAVVSGTSFAAPHVSGVMALLIDAVPAVTVANLEQALRNSAIHPVNNLPANNYGYGLVSALNAYRSFNPDFGFCDGDLNGDGDIDGADLAIMVGEYGRSDCLSGSGCLSDINLDGWVDMVDASLLSLEYGNPDCPTN